MICRIDCASFLRAVLEGKEISCWEDLGWELFEELACDLIIAAISFQLS